MRCGDASGPGHDAQVAACRPRGALSQANRPVLSGRPDALRKRLRHPARIAQAPLPRAGQGQAATAHARREQAQQTVAPQPPHPLGDAAATRAGGSAGHRGRNGRAVGGRDGKRGRGMQVRHSNHGAPVGVAASVRHRTDCVQTVAPRPSCLVAGRDLPNSSPSGGLTRSGRSGGRCPAAGPPVQGRSHRRRSLPLGLPAHRRAISSERIVKLASP